MMAKIESTIVHKTDPSDPGDFDVTEAAVEQGLSERRARRRARGAQKAPTKQQVTLRLDPDVVAKFKAGGPGWQGRINDALRNSAG
jgi:uncharacterized protein (DUF4415 family)